MSQQIQIILEDMEVADYKLVKLIAEMDKIVNEIMRSFAIPELCKLAKKEINPPQISTKKDSIPTEAAE